MSMTDRPDDFSPENDPFRDATQAALDGVRITMKTKFHRAVVNVLENLNRRQDELDARLTRIESAKP